MTVTLKDGLFTFGTQELVEIPNDSAGLIGGIASTNDATQKAPLGVLFRYKGNVYRYVLMNTGAGAVASAAGGVVHWYAIDPVNGKFTVTTDFTDSGGTSVGAYNVIAGVALGVVTTGYYTWIQVAGMVMAYVADSTVAGDVCIAGSTDLYFDRIAADGTITYKPFGVALEAKSNTTSNKAYVLLLGMLW
jgi:hypothetical protein